MGSCLVFCGPCHSYSVSISVLLIKLSKVWDQSNREVVHLLLLPVPLNHAKRTRWAPGDTLEASGFDTNDVVDESLELLAVCMFRVAFLFLVVRPGAPSSVLAPSSDALCS